ncbi:MAG: hypothetical protein LBS89_02715 [Zoogloeaceae bacterium]|jgi:hypothetical protein|nr:hypothetical protein [Zoogloeaceae bacterium]
MRFVANATIGGGCSPTRVSRLNRLAKNRRWLSVVEKQEIRIMKTCVPKLPDTDRPGAKTWKEFFELLHTLSASDEAENDFMSERPDVIQPSFPLRHIKCWVDKG